MGLERGGAERLRTAAREQLSTFLLIGLPAAAGVALVARPLAEVLIGEELRAAAASITPWIALSALLYGLTAYYFGQAFTLGRRTKRLLAAMALPAPAHLGPHLIPVPRLRPVGAGGDGLVRGAGAAGVGAAVGALPPPIGGLAELALDATTGAVVYAFAALALNAAGVRDPAGRLLVRLRARRAAA